MAKKILYIKAANYSGLNAKIKEYLQQHADPGTTVDVVNSQIGPKNLEYEFYQILASQEILRQVKLGENQGYDGIVIGCFDDPALAAAREICTTACVAAPCEAAMNLAATLGSRFSVIIGRDKWVPKMMENVAKYGHREHLASFRSLGMGVLDLQEDHDFTIKRMREEIGRAITEDKAESIILGCTMEFGFYKALQAEFGVPVIDVMLAGLKQAEYLVGLKQNMGWYFSQTIQYAGPDPAEIKEWKMEEEFNLGKLW